MKEKHGRTIGPVDYLIVRFPGNKFTGKIAPELAKLEKNSIIRVIDLVFIMKNEKGQLTNIEAKNLEGETGQAFKALESVDEWFSEADIEEFATSLPNNSSGALLLFENLWAINFKEALLGADAELVDVGRIPPETIAIAEKDLMERGGA